MNKYAHPHLICFIFCLGDLYSSSEFFASSLIIYKNEHSVYMYIYKETYTAAIRIC